jgi:c-di-GMP-binding flagellar brake protein YcgR
MQAAHKVAGEAEDLRQEIEAFLGAIHNAGERRKYERVPSALEVRIAGAGGTIAGRLLDISLGGCRFGGVLPERSGEHVTLLAPAGSNIRCRVVAVEGTATRLQFDLDEATKQKVQALLPAQAA